MARIVVLIGTGTSVGKTYVAERLLRALAGSGVRALGYKPVESGVTEGAETDIARLGRASSFHVKRPLVSFTFAAPIAPHLAARREGRTIDLPAVRGEVERARASDAELVLVELPGGAFSPVTDEVCCAELARSIPEARALLVAPDRLGVLHDIGATTRACAALGLPLFGLVLSAPEISDASTGHNRAELHIVTSVRCLARLDRAPGESPFLPGNPAPELAQQLLEPR